MENRIQAKGLRKIACGFVIFCITYIIVLKQLGFLQSFFRDERGEGIGIGWLEGALLFENGPRKADGNFGWACILAYSILWVVTAKYFFKDWKEAKSGAEVYKNLFLAIVFGLHVIFGGYYIYTLIMVPGLFI